MRNTLQQCPLSTHLFPEKKTTNDDRNSRMNYYEEMELLASFSSSVLGLATYITPCVRLVLHLVV